jgi:hypothetical protein
VTYNPQVGDKVFLRSNEPDEPLVVGRVVRMITLGDSSVPVVKDLMGKERVGGCLRPYNVGDVEVLTALRPIEQWNYLVREDDAMFQIKEKYGVQYKTFKRE